MKNHSHQDTTLDISIIGLMSALVFVGTYFFKIPSAFGYTHLGDCMIILTVCLFGTRRGVLAETTGARILTFHSCQTLTRQEFDRGETYLSLMWKNVDVLKEGLS